LSLHRDSSTTFTEAKSIVGNYSSGTDVSGKYLEVVTESNPGAMIFKKAIPGSGSSIPLWRFRCIVGAVDADLSFQGKE
jgi:hypothetical protein